MKICKRCGAPVLKETDLELSQEYPFYCPNCDENMFSFEVEEPSLPTIRKLWAEFGDVSMDPETECIDTNWNGFAVGTHREEIWHWFEETFNISVAVDLMCCEEED